MAWYSQPVLHRFSALLFAVLLWSGGWVQAQEAGPTDVRILFDISAKMQTTDPDNRRIPATHLLIDSLSEGSRAGIWSYGRMVNLLVNHASVDAAWRSTALERVSGLSAIAQYSNLGAVLDSAAYDFEFSTFQPPVDLVLISDGQVSIAGNDSVNQVERDRILNVLIPRYVAAGARIHTLSLSDQADNSLLEQLSGRTGGVYSRITDPDDLNQFVLAVLDELAEAEPGGNELPLTAEGFRIDQGVSEFNALFLHDAGDIRLISPSGQRTTAQNPGNQEWRLGEGYSLVRLINPETGLWQVEGEIGPDSRIRIVSDMSLRWIVPAGNAVVGNLPLVLELEVLDSQGQRITGLEGLINPSLTINDQGFTALRWQDERLRAQIPNVFETGPLTLEARIEGLGFSRVNRRTVNNSPAFRSEAVIIDQGYQWRLFPSYRELDILADAMVASISGPGGERSEPFEQHPAGYLFLNIPGEWPPGEYQLRTSGRVVVNNRVLTETGIAPLTLRLPVVASFPRVVDLAASPAFLEPPPFEKEPMPVFEEITPSVMQPVVPQPEAVPQVPDQTDESPDTGLSWLSYLLYSLPGIMALIAFYFVYKRLEQKSRPEDDDLLMVDDNFDSADPGEPVGLDLATGFDTSVDDSELDDLDDLDPPLVEDVEPPTPDRTEAPRANMEDSLDTSQLDQDDWSNMDDPSSNDPFADSELDDEDSELFDISNIDDSLSDLDDLNLDEDEDPFAEFDDSDKKKQ